MPTLARPRTAWIIIAGAVALLCVAMLAVPVWHSASLNRWVEKDAADLSPFEVILLQENDPGTRSHGEPLDGVLVAHTAKDRLVVSMTRSEYRYGLLGRDAWVKVHLVTRNPAARESTVPIKLLTHLKRSGNRWAVVDVREIALP